MKASEVLKRYAAGERNFQGINLRGESFQGQNLSGADFSDADIRSTNFTEANLREANFLNAKAGLSYFWLLILAILALMLSALFAFLPALAGAVAGDNFAQIFTVNKYIFAIVLILTTSLPLAVVVIYQGLIGAVSALFFLLVLGTISWIPIALGSLGFGGSGAIGITVAWAGIGTLFQIAFGAIFGALFGILFIKSKIMSVIGTAFGSVVVLLVAVVAEKPLLKLFSIAPEALFGGVIVVLIGSLLGIYVAWSALGKNKKYVLVHNIAIAFSTWGGTSFRGANLTDANFSSSKLKSTDFRNAILTRVRWYGTKMLDLVRPGDTYLKNTQVRQWLIENGKNKNFDRQDLRGINLQGADLTDASFIGADLSEANLQDTNLFRAKLVQTQLDNTDLTGTTLTGAFIEDWVITSGTKLKGVKCEYVFMRLPPEKRPSWLELLPEDSLDPNPRRKPDNWDDNFEEDDFANFMKPIFDTLDLYHNQGVDPRAIAISWKQLAENNPDANLRFASMEVKGENNLLLRLKTERNANLSKLNAEYFELYNHFKSLAESLHQKLLTEKDNQIQAWQNMVATAIEKPRFSRNINIYRGNYNEKLAGDYYEQKGIFGKDNPYIYGSPVQGEIPFFGRKKEFDDIVQAVTKTTKQDILIVGERRTGKTSLLNQINNSLKNPFIPIYIVLNTSKNSTAEGILDIIFKQVINKLFQQKILDQSKIQADNFESLDFIENIKHVITIARNNLPDIRVVLLIDEADYLLQIKQNSSNIIDERPQHFLRAVLQSDIGTYLRAVVAGTTELSTYVSKRSSPFFNHFKHSQLKPFDDKETRDLIIEPAARLGYKYTEKAIQQIINLSGGQPYYCQAICYESFNNALEFKRQEITEDDVSVAKKKIIEDLFNGYESGFWQRFNESEKKFVVSLIKNRPSKNINEANIKRLLDWNIIDKSSGNYRFSSELIREWTLMASNQ